MANATCLNDQCEAKATHKGMCRKHYSAWKYKQPPTSDADRCNFDGCSRRQSAKGMCLPHRSTWQRRQPGYVRPKQKPKMVDIECVYCGKTASVTKQNAKVQKYCGLVCTARATKSNLTYKQWLNRIDRQKPVLYCGLPFQRPIGTVKGKRGRWTAGNCRVCSAPFISEIAGDVTCSIECKSIRDRSAKRRNRDKRRAIKRGAYISPVNKDKVFTADGYRCHLCSKRCDRTKSVPHPMAPTVDHVIPLAAGGTHEPSNCRTACFMCNSRKGDRGGGEQFAMDIYIKA